ncbi:MAG: aspartate kinase [Simkaniaceae bacterium]
MASRIVMKFGGAALKTVADLLACVYLIMKNRKRYDEIVVVTSAMGDTTAQLHQLAQEVALQPDQREVDMLISVGERISMSLMAMALKSRGVDAISFTGSQSGIITCPLHGEARIVDVKPVRILRELEKKRVVIVAGFQGVSQGEVTTLGRSGSDTTAVALGAALSAERVIFYKDVAGVFSEDPKINERAEFFEELNYENALKIVMKGEVLTQRSIKLAYANQLPLYVTSFVNPHLGTKIQDLSLKKKSEIQYESLL